MNCGLWQFGNEYDGMLIVAAASAADAVRQRDAWIARARAAETRTERLSAEEELRECEAVLDRLYSQGF